MEDEVKNLKKHMGAVLMTVKDLKGTIQVLEKRLSDKENDEIKEIIEKQKMVEEVLAANSDAIKRIDFEMKKFIQINSEVEVSTNATKLFQN